MYKLDEDTRQELIDTFDDLVHDIELTLEDLTASPTNESLNKLFRDIHTIKGHASMFAFKEVVDFTHALEELAEGLRSHRYAFSFAICECIHVSMECLRGLHERDVSNKAVSNLNEMAIRDHLLAISKASSEQADECANALLDDLSSKTNTENQITDKPEENSIQHKPFYFQSNCEANNYADLAFFQELSFQMDSVNPYWVARSIQLYDWAQKMNQLADSAIDYQQLAAATYMHDLGMTLVRHSILHKTEKLEKQELDEIKRHPVWGFELINRMPGWNEAANMILQHHERIDGTGYPSGLAGNDIHPGAKILAILDAFFSMINGRADRAQRRTSMRAITEINAKKGTQFDEYWVDIFNTMIKAELKSGDI